MTTAQPQPTLAEVEAALMAALPVFVSEFLAKRGYQGALGQAVPVKQLAQSGVVEMLVEPRVLWLRPLPPPEPSTPEK